jgi:hypothetical protein
MMRGVVVLSAGLSAALAMQSAPAALFSPAPFSPVRVGTGSGTALVADINNDGEMDLLTRHLLSRRITVSLGAGSGRFRPPATLSLDYSPGDMKLGDVNADGVLDLAITPGTTDVVHVLLGDGRGSFVPAAGSPFTVSDAADELNKRTLHLVDLDEDGHLDLITANGRRRNTFTALFGDGRGGFRRGPAVPLESGRDRYWYAFGDLDGDGHLDVATASNGFDGGAGQPGRVLVQSGDGRGTFTPMSPAFSLPADAGPVAGADMNGDGRLDVAIAHSSGGVSLLLNAGRGRFTPAPGSPIPLGSRGYALVAEDVNADGQPDLVAATVDSVTVLLATPSGYAHAPGSPFRAGPGAFNLALADVNKDGRLDIAASSFEGNGVTVLLAR